MPSWGSLEGFKCPDTKFNPSKALEFISKRNREKFNEVDETEQILNEKEN